MGFACKAHSGKPPAPGTRQGRRVAKIFTLLAFFAFELRADSRIIGETMTHALAAHD